MQSNSLINFNILLYDVLYIRVQLFSWLYWNTIQYLLDGNALSLLATCGVASASDYLQLVACLPYTLHNMCSTHTLRSINYKDLYRERTAVSAQRSCAICK